MCLCEQHYATRKKNEEESKRLFFSSLRKITTTGLHKSYSHATFGGPARRERANLARESKVRSQFGRPEAGGKPVLGAPTFPSPRMERIVRGEPDKYVRNLWPSQAREGAGDHPTGLVAVHVTDRVTAVCTIEGGWNRGLRRRRRLIKRAG